MLHDHNVYTTPEPHTYKDSIAHTIMRIFRSDKMATTGISRTMVEAL